MALAVVLSVPATAGAWTPGPATYGVGKQVDREITMRDGTKLRADVYYPTDPETGGAAPGPFPVILTQTPYSKFVSQYVTAIGSGPNPYLIQRGYIHVIADVRGTGASGGSFDLLDPVQASDGAHLVRWASKLPHAEPSVGLLGISYLALNQFFTAAKLGPDSPLKAIFPVVPANDPYRDILFDGGIVDFEFGAIDLPVWLATMGLGPIARLTGDPSGFLATELEHLLSLGDFPVSTYADIVSGGDRAYDGPFWRKRAPRNVLDEIVANGIPAFIVGGWFDVFQRGEPLDYSGFQNVYSGRPVGAPMLPDQAATGRYQLLMGSWYHLNPGAGLDIDRIQLAWYDRWLKGEDTGIDETDAPLHLQEFGTDRWVDVSRYPLEQADPTTYYLGEGGTLTKTAPTVATGQDQVAFLGVASPCNRSTEQWATGGLAIVLGESDPCATDDRTTQIGPGAVTYTTTPLAHPTDIAGPIDATLYATSTRPDTEFVATVEDVSADGKSKPLTSGALLGSFRRLDTTNTWYAADGNPIAPYHPFTRGSAQPVVPGQVTRFDIEIRPIFARLAAGHSLRLTIATSDTPHLLPTPSQFTKLVGGIYQVQRHAGAASFLEVPLAPPSAFGTLCSICH